ncbi:MAG: MgtC/SapB family protein [Halodesulfurarchaeum sp.]
MGGPHIALAASGSSLLAMIGGIFDLVTVPELLQEVLIAMALGALIGIERERRSGKYAGLRTLTILAGSGPAIVYYADVVHHHWVIAIYLSLAAALALFIAYIRFQIQGSDVGLTTSVTVFMVALLGVLVGYGLLIEATGIAIVATFLLAERKQLHDYVDQLTDDELIDAIKLGALIFILYPILPTEPIDPWGAIHLRKVLVFAVFVLLIQFAAYISMRQIGGSRGLQVTGILGGGANSLATAGVMARMANRSENAIDAASSGLLLAAGSMVLRNVALASISAFVLFWTLWPAAAGLLGVLVGFSLLGWHQRPKTGDIDIDMESPFSFRSAAKFAAVYMAISIASTLSEQFFGDIGLYVTAYAGGLVSSAAVAVSAGSLLSNGSTSVEAATGMVVLGIIASLSSKIVLIEVVNDNMRTKATVPMVLSAMVGATIFFVL